MAITREEFFALESDDELIDSRGVVWRIESQTDTQYGEMTFWVEYADEGTERLSLTDEGIVNDEGALVVELNDPGAQVVKKSA